VKTDKSIRKYICKKRRDVGQGSQGRQEEKMTDTKGGKIGLRG
jgi:hypothetical protein